MYLSPVTKVEIWKMKSFKKLLAMLLAVVNLPTKAAGNQCMQFIVGDMKGTFDTNDTASSGDTIVLDGKWYLGSTGTAYTFDKMTYRYNGSAWCKVFDTTLNQVGINDTNRFFLHYNEIQTTSNMADIFFVAQEGATFTYNGVEVTAMTGLKLTGSGMQFDVGLMTIGTSADNQRSATPGDIVSFGGTWKYTPYGGGAPKLVTFETTSYIYNGNGKWVSVIANPEFVYNETKICREE